MKETIKFPFISDFINAQHYQEILKKNKKNLTFSLFTDGAKIANSNTTQIWPLLAILLELPPFLRFTQSNTFWCAIWLIFIL